MGLSENWKRLKAKQGVASPSKEKNVLKLRKHKGVKNEIKLKPPAVKKLSTQKSPLEVYLWGTDEHPGKDAVGKFVAIDCEFVGVGDNDKSVLARVSLVNYYGVILLDTFVKPEKKVTNWRTWVSGVAPHHMREAIIFKDAQEKVKLIISGRTLVGHALGLSLIHI